MKSKKLILFQVGNCHTTQKVLNRRANLCYVHQPDTCPDAVESSTFPRMKFSQVACLNSFLENNNPIGQQFPRNSANLPNSRNHQRFDVEDLGAEER